MRKEQRIIAEQEMLKTFGVKVGDRVISISSIDRYPDFLLEQEITGTVELMNITGDLMVKVDKHISELDEWDNYLTYPDDGCEYGFVEAFKMEFKVFPG